MRPLLHRAVVWVRGLQEQVLHVHSGSSGCCLPRWAEPRHGAGFSPQTRGTGWVKPSVAENHILPKCLKETNMLVTLDGNWIHWSSKPVQGINRTWGKRPLNQPQLLYYQEAGPP